MVVLAPSIPVSEIVRVVPSVLSAGNVGIVFNGLLATQDVRVPIGTVQRFATSADVADYFGPSDKITALAQIYFLGYTNSFIKPQRFMVAQWPLAAVGAYLRGGDVGSGGLDAIKTVNSTLSVVVDGGAASTGTVNLTSATSFSNAATIIGTAISKTVTYDANLGAFVIHSATTGPSSTLAFATGAAAAPLKLTSATGAVLSQGSAAQNAATFLAGIINVSQGWVSFTTDWEPTDADKQAIAAWFNAQDNRYVNVMYDSSASDKTTTPSTAVQAIRDADYGGTFMLYTDNSVDTLGGELAAFTMGSIASVDLQRLNGRVTFAFRRQSGLPAMVKDATSAKNLEANEMNYYGSWSEADDEYIFMYPGQITGVFKWLDSYLNQIWIASQLRTSMMNLLMNLGSLPYNKDGYALIEAAAQDVIFQAVDFGAIRVGIALSETQKGIINSQAGLTIDTTITKQGWYFLVTDPTPQVRAARGTPVCTLWYADGQSVQRITIGSVEIQ